MRSWYSVGFLLAVSCTRPAAHTAPVAPLETAAPASDPAAAAPAPDVPSAGDQPDLGERKHQYLLLLDSGEVVLRSRSTNTQRVLAAHADAVLYQAPLELLWYRDEAMLKVIDLRTLASAPVLVASGMPDVNRLAIDHPDAPAETEDGCDLDLVTLHWSDAPTIGAAFSKPASLRIENAAWLRAERMRRARPASERRSFSQERVRLPKSVLHCENTEACGTSVAFGASGLTLVRVREEMGGDCWRNACLLRDAHGAKYASPLTSEGWTSANKAASGPCGLYMFDPTQTAFLQSASLCIVGQPCSALEGHAVGWLEPGPVVGAAGL